MTHSCQIFVFFVSDVSVLECEAILKKKELSKTLNMEKIQLKHSTTEFFLVGVMYCTLFIATCVLDVNLFY